MATWYTDENGCYDKTFYLDTGIYTLFVQSETPDCKIFGFILPPAYVFAVDQFWVWWDYQDRNFSPIITDGNEIVKMLVNVWEVKKWATANFGITRNFINIVYPKSDWMGPHVSAYCPNVYWLPYEWALLADFSDRIYKYPHKFWGKEGMEDIAHEWGHSFYYGTLFNHVVPSGVTDFEEHSLTMVSNPGFAWNEGFAEFFEYASVMDDFPYNTS
ncbi:MAG: hypothetical protein ABIL20_03790 [candidate division WOR-3 bacterium]